MKRIYIGMIITFVLFFTYLYAGESFDTLRFELVDNWMVSLVYIFFLSGVIYSVYTTLANYDTY